MVTLVCMVRTLGGYIEEYLSKSGQSQTDLATRSGVPRITINRLVNRKTALPDAEVRRKLAEGMGVTHLDILVAAGELEPEEAKGAGATLTQTSSLPGVVQQALRDADWSNPGLAQTVASVLAIARGVDPADVMALPDTALDQLRAMIKSGEIDEDGAQAMIVWWDKFKLLRGE